MRVQPSPPARRPPWVMARCLPLCALVFACGGGFHTPAQDATVGLAAKAEPLTSNGHTLSVSRARLVVGSLELQAAEGGSEVVEGPFLVDASLDGKWVKLAETALPHGEYTALKLNLRPLSSSSAADVAAAHAAGFDDLVDSNAPLAIDGAWDEAQYSIEPKGPFSRLVTFAQPWRVRVGSPANLSLSTTADHWFPSDAYGELTDPRTADADDVLDRFANSLQGGEDDDRNGVTDH
jgi:hypothetical protein